MNAIRTQLGDDRVLTVMFDQPDRPVNTITRRVLDELSGVVAQIEAGAVAPRGVVFTSAKPDAFISGADLYEFQQMDGDALRAFLADGQALFERIHRLNVPTVAAINGHCLGGGLELAMACDASVAADRGGIRIGFPEVKLGILPGWGGTTRLTRRLGVRRALPLILAGRVGSPRVAQRLGLIDEVVRAEALPAAARRLLAHPPRARREPWVDRAIRWASPLRRLVLRVARRQAEAAAHGHYPAVDEVLRVVAVAVRGSVDDGLRAEREAVERLMETDACRNLLRVFFLRQDSKRDIKRRYDGLAPPVQHAAVIGGGTMGAGIAHALIRAGVHLRLVEVDPAQVSHALRRIDKLLGDDLRAKRVSPLERERAMHRVSPCADWTGLGLADLAIEAVPEDIDLKRQTFAKLDRLARPDAVLASNTSSIPIGELAALVEDPRRVIGLHFFNPVAKMPLVEVVRAPASDPRAVAAGAVLALRLGQSPVVVGDGPGFLVNRLLIPYLAEAMTLAGEGLPIAAIDRAMRRWGMPMGPFELLDQVGLRVAYDIFRSVGPRIQGLPEMPDALRVAVDRGWLGRRAGRGFYRYAPKRWRLQRRPSVNDALQRVLQPVRTRVAPPVDASVIQLRLVGRMIHEAERVLDEQIVEDPDTIDLATVLGLGLAPFRGGLMRFAHAAGLAEHAAVEPDAPMHAPPRTDRLSIRQAG